jgi:hypothetical protein
VKKKQWWSYKNWSWALEKEKEIIVLRQLMVVKAIIVRMVVLLVMLSVVLLLLLVVHDVSQNAAEPGEQLAHLEVFAVVGTPRLCQDVPSFSLIFKSFTFLSLGFQNLHFSQSKFAVFLSPQRP